MVLTQMNALHVGIVDLGGQGQISLSRQKLALDIIKALLAVVELHVDAIRLRQILHNQIGNKVGQGGEAHHADRAGIGVDVVLQGRDAGL